MRAQKMGEYKKSGGIIPWEGMIPTLVISLQFLSGERPIDRNS